MSRQMDTNIDNYTVDELLTILELDGNIDDIISKTDFYIDKFNTENNEKMATFFQDMQKRLIQFSADADVDPQEALAEQTDEWFGNQALTQTDSNQQNKSTDRVDKIDVYDNNHAPMNRKQLGVNNTFSVPVSQDQLNPTLKNITERFIILDSQFRQTGDASSTDYTLDLSDHLTDVLSLRLYSFQIPVSWYIIDPAYGNTCFWITDGSNNVLVSIPAGNYSADSFVIALNKAFAVANISNTWPIPNPVTYTPVTYNSSTGKININLTGAKYWSSGGLVVFTVSANTLFTFFDYTATLQCVDKCAGQNLYINQTLGYVMGFRLPFINVVIDAGNTGVGILDLLGPKYFILVIDDFNQNHLNNGLVTITEISRTLKMPEYYSPDLPYVCVATPPNISNLQANIANIPASQAQDAGELLMDKLNANFNPYQQLVPSAPRTLTQSQLYTINEIIKNNERNYNFRTRAPTTTDVLAIIPIKGPLNLGELYTDYSGSLQDFKRTYFGPVGIDRMRVRLLDDKGNTVNLNGLEWTVTLISENLYQY